MSNADKDGEKKTKLTNNHDGELDALLHVLSA